MIWTAVSTLIAVFSVFSFPGLSIYPVIVSALALLVWVAWGGRACLVAAIAAWALFNAGEVLESRLQPSLSRQDILLRGTVCRFPRSGAGPRGAEVVRFHLDVEPDGAIRSLPDRFYLSWFDSTQPVAIGERWQFMVRVREPRGLGNPAGFDYERWLFAMRIGGIGYVRPSKLNRRLDVDPGGCAVARLRGELATAIESALPGHPGLPYLLGLVVGARHLLDDQQWALLRHTGTVHLMAISGLHIGLIAVFFFFIGKLIARLLLAAGIRCSPVFCGRWGAVLAAVVYSALAGFSVSTIRAVVMLGVAALLAGRRRHFAPSDILCAALLAVLCADPFAILSSGFWLSFAAVALLMMQWLQLAPAHRAGATRGGWPNRLVRSAGALVRAQLLLSIGLATFVIGYFQQLSVIGPVANLLAVPVFSMLVIPLALAGAVVLVLAPYPGQWLLERAADAVVLAVDGLTWLNQLPFSVWSPPPMSRLALLAAFAGSLLVIWPRPLAMRWLAPLWFLPAVIPVFWSTLGPTLGPTFLPTSSNGAQPGGAGHFRVIVADVGQGLAVAVQTGEGTLLYDAGPSYGDRDAAQTVVLPVLRYFGIQDLEALVVSHGDSDHAGGAASIINAYPDVRLIATQRFDLTARRYLQCRQGLEWNRGGVTFRVLHPAAQSGTEDGRRWSDNDASCVLSVTSPFGSLLLPGDIEDRAERHLVRSRTVQPVDLVVAPHHGSTTSSGFAFVRAVQARYVVFTTGHANRWGFPRRPVLERWTAAGSCSADTADSGAMVFETMQGGRLDLVWRYRQEGRKPWTYESVSREVCPLSSDSP